MKRAKAKSNVSVTRVVTTDDSPTIKFSLHFEFGIDSPKLEAFYVRLVDMLNAILTPKEIDSLRSQIDALRKR